MSEGQSETIRMTEIYGAADGGDYVSRMVIITLEELKAKMDRGDAFTLFEVLPLMYFRKHHLPTAKNLPPNSVAEVVQELVPDRDAEIILYCWDHDCPTS